MSALAEVEALEAAWDAAAGASPGEVSVQLRTVHGHVAGRRAQIPHYAASTVKLAVLVAALAEVAAGRLRLEDELAVRDTFASAAGGRFALRQLDDQDDATWACLGGDLALGILLERMVADSSNIATNVVVETLGWGPVHRAAALACGEEMTMHHLIGDASARVHGPANAVTAAGLARLLSSLAAGRLLPPAQTRHALDLLAAQRHRHMIPAGLPATAWSASKGGWTADVTHDVALVRPGRAPAYVLAVCTTTGSEAAAEGLVARLSAVTWERWTRWHAS